MHELDVDRNGAIDNEAFLAAAIDTQLLPLVNPQAKFGR